MIVRHCLWPRGIGARLRRNELRVRILAGVGYIAQHSHVRQNVWSTILEGILDLLQALGWNALVRRWGVSDMSCI